MRTNYPDGLLHNLYVLLYCATPDTHGELCVQGGMSNNGGDDGKHSSDANTNHVPNNYVHTTNLANIPNTKEMSMRTKRGSRTNRILPVYIHTQALLYN